MGSKRSLYDSRPENAASQLPNSQDMKRVNYFSLSINKVHQVATPIMHYWHQTPLVPRVIAIVVAVPMLFLPVISFLFCLPAIVFAIVAGYSGLFGKEAFVADVKETFREMVPSEQAEKLYSNISTAKTKQVPLQRVNSN